MSRRAFLKGLAATPLAFALPARTRSDEPGGAGDVLARIDALELEVEARLGSLGGQNSAARTFATSVLHDHARHRLVRARVRQELGLSAPAAKAAPAPADASSLVALRRCQKSLVYAHVEGLPSFPSHHQVDALGHNMVDLARHLTVIELWTDQGRTRA
jgi:hypothetical protein